MTGPRAVGRRIAWEQLPHHVRDSVAAALGSHVRSAVGQVGGMSPGVAARVVTQDGRRFFVKAVGTELNHDTPSLFRTEAAVLARLPDAPWRPTLRATIADGDWIALVLDDIVGRHPRFDDAADLRSVRAAYRAQTAELTPPPSGVQVITAATMVTRWARRWDDVAADARRFLPERWAADARRWRERVHALAGRLPATTLCHWDVRDDNLLVRRDGTTVVLDWGLARLGPAWLDALIVEVQPDDVVSFPSRVAALDADPRDVVDLLVGFGGSQAWNAQQTPKPNLEAMPAFCAGDSHRLLTRAAALLDAATG